MGLNGLIDVFVKMQHTINSGVGRDKMCRIIQYFLLFLIPQLQSAGAHNQDIVRRLSALKGSMS